MLLLLCDAVDAADKSVLTERRLFRERTGDRGMGGFNTDESESSSSSLEWYSASICGAMLLIAESSLISNMPEPGERTLEGLAAVLGRLELG
jgi:hypothetical protein